MSLFLLPRSCFWTRPTAPRAGDLCHSRWPVNGWARSQAKSWKERQRHSLWRLGQNKVLRVQMLLMFLEFCGRSVLGWMLSDWKGSMEPRWSGFGKWNVLQSGGGTKFIEDAKIIQDENWVGSCVWVLQVYVRWYFLRLFTWSKKSWLYDAAEFIVANIFNFQLIIGSWSVPVCHH